MSVLLVVLAALIAAGFGIALLDLAIRRAEVGAALVFLSAIAQAVFIYNVPSVRLGGMRVGVTDLVAVIVLAAAVARCLRLRRLSHYQHWLIMLGSLLLVSVVLGIAAYGFQVSVGDSRQYVFFVGAALYMATFRPSADLYDRIGRIWLMAAVLMMLLACARWLDVFAGIHLGVPAESNGVDTAIRVLDGPYTFFLAGPLLLTVPFWRRPGQRRWIRWLGAVLLLVLLALDRRTVWLAILVGVAVLLLRGRRLRARAVLLVIAAAVVIGVAFAGDGLARDQAPAGTVTSTGSVTWRVEGWSDLVDSWSESPVNWLVGRPFGSGFVHIANGEIIDAQPHNFYIETMIRAGVGGLIALSRSPSGCCAGCGGSRPRVRGCSTPACCLRCWPCSRSGTSRGSPVRAGDRDRHRHRRCLRGRAQGRSGPSHACDPRPAGTGPIRRRTCGEKVVQ